MWMFSKVLCKKNEYNFCTHFKNQKLSVGLFSKRMFQVNSKDTLTQTKPTTCSKLTTRPTIAI